MTDVDRELMESLSRRLSSQFLTSPAQKHWSYPYWAFDLTAGQDRFIVGIRKSRWQDQWIFMIQPGAVHLWLGLMRQQTARCVFDVLLNICHQIHSLLADTAGVTNIRWYINASGTTTATPEQLFQLKYEHDGWKWPPSKS
jgi:hypothetical protein